MLKRFFPNDYVKNVYEINYKKLKKDKVKGLIFDIDNTLVPYYIKQGDQKLVDLFEDLKKRGFRICLVSNGKKDRVVKFNENLKLVAIHKAQKPRRINLRKAMNVMKTTKENTVMIGDQVFTDVWAGNRAGMRTILVEPVSEKDEWITGIKRGIELKVINAYLKAKEKIKE